MELKEFTRRMQKISRPTNLIFRMGGEEFFTLPPQTDLAGGNLFLMKAG